MKTKAILSLHGQEENGENLLENSSEISDVLLRTWLNLPENVRNDDVFGEYQSQFERKQSKY